MSINSISSSSDKHNNASSLVYAAQAQSSIVANQIIQHNYTSGAPKDSISISKESILQSEAQMHVLPQSERLDISNPEEAKNAVRTIIYYLKSNGLQIIGSIKTSSTFITLTK